MNRLLADAAPAADLLDVFNAYDGGVVFRGLAEGGGGHPSVLGRIGWIFTGFGALFALWGFVLRTRGASGEGKMGEIAHTWIVIGLMLGGPFLMTAAMEASDSLCAGSVGGPRDVTVACVKAAYAMPELNSLFDVLRKAAVDQQGSAAAQASAKRMALIGSVNDGSVLGYIEALGVSVWDTAAADASGLGQTWSGLVRLVSLGAGFGSAMLKCLLIAVTLVPLYFLFLLAAAIVWFMEQLRYFLAVSATAMLPLFVGMFSMPAGHPNRQAAQGYVMHMVSLALWPVSWAIGHSGTVALYDALVSLIAGTSRVADMVGVLQWDSITTAAPTQAQVQVVETALGNWFMGNLTALLSILVGGLGFTLWVLCVTILGPVFLHRMLSTGALFFTQAASATGRQGASALRLAYGAAQGLPGLSGRLAAAGPVHGERLMAAAAQPVSFAAGLSDGRGYSEPGSSAASMSSAARSVDISDGNAGSGM